MNRTGRVRSRSAGVTMMALGVVLLVLLCTGPAGATAAYAPTVSQLSPQAGYNTSALNITNLAGTYGINASRVTLQLAGSPVGLTKKGSLLNSPTVKLDGATAVYVNGSYAYVASNVSGALEIVNIANPAAPVHAGSIANGNLVNASGIFVHGKYAYIASQGSNALEIVDISNPSSPAHVNAVVNGAGGYTTLSAPSAVFVANDTDSTEVMAYVVSTGSNALQIIGVTNPASTQKRGTISNTAGAVGNMSKPRAIFVSGKYAYIAVNNGLLIVDVTGSWGPLTQAGFLKHGTGGALLAGTTGVQVVGNYAFVASNTSKALEIVDVTNPANPKHKGKLVNNTGGAMLDSPASVSVMGIYAYVVNRNSGYLEVIDVSNPAAPKHKAKLNLGAGYVPAGIFVSGDTAYIASSQHKSLDIVGATTGSISATGVRALTVYRESSRLIFMLALKGKPAGNYHVVMMNPSLQQGILLNGFTIYKPPVIPREPYPAWKGRGVLNNTGIYNDGGSRPNGKLLWNSTGVKFVSSTPVIANGLVYAGDLDRIFYAIHISNGTVRWSKQLDDIVVSAPAVSEGRLFVGTGNSAYNPRTFYALNATTGAELWKNTSSLGGFSASPTVYNGKVIVGRDDGNVTAWNVVNGREVWRFKTAGAVHSPAVANGKVVVSTNGNLYSLDAATGKKFWDGRNSSSGWDGSVVLQSSPAVAYGKVYIGTSYYVRAFDEVTGALLYQYPIAGAALEGSPAVANGYVHIATTGGSPGLSGGNGIYTLFANNLTLKWVNHTPENTVMTASPAVANGVVYITSDRQNQANKGFLYAWNAATGAPLWQFHLPGGGTDSSPAVIDGVVYLGQWWQGFLAIGTQHKVTLTAPNGGESWSRGGTPKTIRWVYNATPMPCANVKLDLSKGGVFNRAIVASTPIGAGGSGSYTWSIPLAATVGTNYQVNITCGASADLSNDYFTISA